MGVGAQVGWCTSGMLHRTSEAACLLLYWAVHDHVTLLQSTRELRRALHFFVTHAIRDKH